MINASLVADATASTKEQSARAAACAPEPEGSPASAGRRFVHLCVKARLPQWASRPSAAFAWKEQPCERHRVRRGAATRVTSRQADRPALHPWLHEHPRAGAESLGMRGEQVGRRLGCHPGRDARAIASPMSSELRYLRASGLGEWLLGSVGRSISGVLRVERGCSRALDGVRTRRLASARSPRTVCGVF